MKKIKNNKIIDLRNKTENEKISELGNISKKINSIFQENTSKGKIEFDKK